LEEAVVDEARDYGVEAAVDSGKRDEFFGWRWRQDWSEDLIMLVILNDTKTWEKLTSFGRLSIEPRDVMMGSGNTWAVAGQDKKANLDANEYW
jgi:hypothetical protein